MGPHRSHRKHPALTFILKRGLLLQKGALKLTGNRNIWRFTADLARSELLSRMEQHLSPCSLSAHRKLKPYLSPEVISAVASHSYILSTRYPDCPNQIQFHLLMEIKDSETTHSITIFWSGILQNLTLISSLMKTFSKSDYLHSPVMGTKKNKRKAVDIFHYLPKAEEFLS